MVNNENGMPVLAAKSHQQLLHPASQPSSRPPVALGALNWNRFHHLSVWTKNRAIVTKAALSNRFSLSFLCL